MSRVIAPAGAHSLSTRVTTMPSSEAKQGFANLIQRVVRTNEPVVITRHSQPTAVLLSLEEYTRLVAAVPDPLASLRQKFDQLLTAMQTSKAKAGIDVLFAATPAQLGAAAVKAARQDSH